MNHEGVNMAVPDNYVSFAGFLVRSPVQVRLGYELHVLIHDFSQRYDESLLSDGYGVAVRVRLPALPEDQLQILRRGDRVQIMGQLIAGGLPDDPGRVDPRPLIAAFGISRSETLHAISRANHPLNPRWHDAPNLAAKVLPRCRGYRENNP